ncbi:peptidylprolyl isomerase [Actinocrispum wychmicini]|uniref:peptidylprolyl isomerase n=1 Tax=Actinocrispum wychmicini TaxID=1213861 RepID=UPI001FB6C7A3|nr:peptidylprolyl isomerase [Actinocrispum wychmicini]
MTYPPPRGRRTELIVGFGVAAVILVGVLVWTLVPALHPTSSVPGTALAGAAPPKTASSQPSAGGGPCGYRRAGKAAREVGLPAATPPQPSGTVRVTLKTNQGDIPLVLDRGKAPCTVQNILFLAGKKYFDGTQCHRLTAAQSLKVLQCGDPTGTGAGGPGYKFKDELPTGLTPGAAGGVIYPTATVAMANAGPDTNGSQFFLVYGDSTIPPNYSVFGTVDTAGLAVISKIVAGGINPSMGPEDGAPKTPVTIQGTVADG